MMKHQLEKEKRSGLILFIIGTIILISAIIWAIIRSLDIGIYVLAMGYPIIYSIAFGLFLLIIGIYTLLSNPRNKGLLLLIIGSLLTSVGSYYTINVFLNFEIFKFEPQIIVYVVISIIIGIIIILFGINLSQDGNQSQFSMIYYFISNFIINRGI
ncbi:hypothetical protein ES705_04905 [subsurface metagenome]